MEYEEYPFVLDVQEAMKDGAPQLHEDYPNNKCAHAISNISRVYDERLEKHDFV